MQLIIMKQDKPPHYKGDIVEIRASGTPFTGKEPDAFVLVEVPDVPMKEFEGYNLSWQRTLAFDVVASDAAQDGFRLRLYSETENSGAGAITKEEIDSFIQAWSGTIVSYGANEVVFDITILGALTSPAFWGLDNIASQVIFSELSYDQATGIHRIQADYSAIGNNPTYVERYVQRMGLEIISHQNKVLVYDADRDVVSKAFKDDLKDKGDKQVTRRRYHISTGVVDTIIGAGGTYTTDKATLLSYVKDKVVE
ncbi:MAG: hypothetical protein LC687_07410 [Actinobacteria bacterium]|nr:hypothetical protein [Actinomycetota bacterium]MCA1807657.1 hypothetical protein [Actinomycetota bacterium]